MSGEPDSGADVSGWANVRLVVHYASGIEYGGVSDRDMGADICSGGYNDILADGCCFGYCGRRMDRADQVDSGLLAGLGVGSSDGIVADGDDNSANTQFAKAGNDRQVPYDLNAVDSRSAEEPIGVEKSCDAELVVASQDIKNNPTVSASPNDGDLHICSVSWRCWAESSTVSVNGQKATHTKQVIGMTG